MDENVEAAIRNEFHKQDLNALLTQFREHESLLRLKRRWLMDLPLSNHEQKRLDELLPPNDKILPESFLREDDVSYEDIRTCIEMGFGSRKSNMKLHFFLEEAHISSPFGDFKDILSRLDDMTNAGLCSMVKIITGGMIKFEKANWRMKKTIQEFLYNLISCKDDSSMTKVKQLFQVLKDPQNFRGHSIGSSIPCETYYAAAVRVLDGLEDFSFKTLAAMHRKLLGVRGYVPVLLPSRNGRGRHSLIGLIQKRCIGMLLKLGKLDKPAEPLAAALGVAGLNLKLILNCPPAIEFRTFPPEIEALQNNIAKAIWLLNEAKRVDLIELRKVQLLLDPNAELSVRSLRMAVRNFLTEYLFECADMDKVPDCLIETLDLINNRNRSPKHRKHSSVKTHSSPKELMKNEIQNEVECILTVSAQAKQIVWQSLPEYEFDQDFARAYIQDYADGDTYSVSDDDYDSDQAWGIPQKSELPHYSCGQTESIGEASPVELNSPVSTSDFDGFSSHRSPNERLNVPGESMHTAATETCMSADSPEYKESNRVIGRIIDREDPSGCTREQGLACSGSLGSETKQDLSSFQSPVINSNQNSKRNLETTRCSIITPKLEDSDFMAGPEDLVCKQSKSSNLYLEIQEACDGTTMVAYRVVGHMLDKLAMTEGIELYQGDRSYLHSCASVPEDIEVSHSTLLSSLFGIWNNVRMR